MFSRRSLFTNGVGGRGWLLPHGGRIHQHDEVYHYRSEAFRSFSDGRRGSSSNGGGRRDRGNRSGGGGGDNFRRNYPRDRQDQGHRPQFAGRSIVGAEKAASESYTQALKLEQEARRQQQRDMDARSQKWLTSELSILARYRDWKGALETFQSSAVGVQGGKPMVQPNVFHYTTVMSACAKAGRWEEACSMFSHMTSKGKGTAESTAAANADDLQIKPNPYTFSALIHSCSEGGQPDLALRAFSLMQNYDVPANLHTLTSVVTACAKGGKWEKAIAVLEAAEDSLIAPNVVTYSAAIDGCRRVGKWDTAIALVEQMYAKNTASPEVRPTDITWNSILKACASQKRWAESLSVFAAMRSAGYQPVQFTVDTLEECFTGSEREWDLRGTTHDMPIANSKAMHLLRMTHGQQERQFEEQEGNNGSSGEARSIETD